ncbi:MAG TPA: FAD-dependent oxidoreductase [Geobacteraceae bacterium]|nr:FAD-dependent oxidoreductase [Geobacteraceae bacterium]
MPHYKYLIIGAGMTADAAARGIREADPDGTIGMIGRESDPPYDRPPLTKKLWKGKPLEIIWRKTSELGVVLHLGRAAQVLEPNGRRVFDDGKTEYTYEKLLLATGGVPRQFPFGEEGIIYYRTLDDYRNLRALTEAKNRFAVIGGGFIGTEIAAALSMTGREVVIIFPEKELGDRIFPHDLARFASDYYRRKGINLIAGEMVTGISKKDSLYSIKTRENDEILVDAVVAGLGIKPDTELARAAGLDVGNGIVVDELLRTSRPDIYAAGDVASFFNPALGDRIRVEHEDNAKAMGKQAGRNMAGMNEPYHYLPAFYSDLFELGYEAVGELDSRLETVSDWMEPYRKGVVYYLREGRVRGVLLWNIWKQVDAARRLIAEPGPFRADDLRGRLPE